MARAAGPHASRCRIATTREVLKTIPKDFLDDATACVLYSGTTHLSKRDGTDEAITHEITRLNSRKGIDKLGEYRSIYFDPTYEKLTLNEARVIKANGKIVPIEPKHVQLRDLGTDFQVYDQGKQLVISFPNLEVGDTYEVKWTIRGRRRGVRRAFLLALHLRRRYHAGVARRVACCSAEEQDAEHETVNGKVDLVVTEMRRREAVSLERANDRRSCRGRRTALERGAAAASGQSRRFRLGSRRPWKQKLRTECWKCTPEVRKIVDDVTRG